MLSEVAKDNLLRKLQICSNGGQPVGMSCMEANYLCSLIVVESGMKMPKKTKTQKIKIEQLLMQYD